MNLKLEVIFPSERESLRIKQHKRKTGRGHDRQRQREEEGGREDLVRTTPAVPGAL